MTTNAQRGTAFEGKVREELEGEGWFVMRSAGSHGLVDLIAMKALASVPHPRVWLVQCKLYGVISGRDARALKELAQGLNCAPVLAYKVKPGGLIHFCIVDDRTRVCYP